MEDPHGPEADRIYEGDGTECFRWDESLWQAADHFRYRFHRFKELKQAIIGLPRDSRAGAELE